MGKSSSAKNPFWQSKQWWFVGEFIAWLASCAIATYMVWWFVDGLQLATGLALRVELGAAIVVFAFGWFFRKRIVKFLAPPYRWRLVVWFGLLLGAAYLAIGPLVGWSVALAGAFLAGSVAFGLITSLHRLRFNLTRMILVTLISGFVILISWWALSDVWLAVWHGLQQTNMEFWDFRWSTSLLLLPFFCLVIANAIHIVLTVWQISFDIARLNRAILSSLRLLPSLSRGLFAFLLYTFVAVAIAELIQPPLLRSRLALFALLPGSAALFYLAISSFMYLTVPEAVAMVALRHKIQRTLLVLFLLFAGWWSFFTVFLYNLNTFAPGSIIVTEDPTRMPTWFDYAVDSFSMMTNAGYSYLTLNNYLARISAVFMTATGLGLLVVFIGVGLSLEQRLNRASREKWHDPGTEADHS